MDRVKAFLEFVSKNNEFYKNVVKLNDIFDYNDITLYPPLTRKCLQENRHNMFSNGYEQLYYAQQLKCQSSSGTSGVPVHVYWDHKDYYASMRTLWRKRLTYYGIHPYERYVKFTLNAMSANNPNNVVSHLEEYNNILNINISTAQNEKDYKRIIDLISEFKPRWLYIQPFILRKLIEYYVRFDAIPPSSLSYIESVGELLPLELQEKAKKHFNIPIANLYGSEEMNGIAYECPFHKMHVLSENVYVECQDANGISRSGEGEAIITNLLNKAMPLIRYKQGDIIHLKDLSEPCPCGSSEPIVEIIKGRTYENIKVGKVELNPFMLMSTLSNINNEFDSIITCYRYIYSRCDKKLICYIVLNMQSENWFDSVKQAILSALHSKIVPLCDITVEVVQEDAQPVTGKHKLLEIVD